jgi:hypothetical protein
LLDLRPGGENWTNGPGVIGGGIEFEAGGTLIAEDEQVVGDPVKIGLH